MQGIGAAIVAPLSLTLLSAATPAEQRGLALGIWSGVSGLGVALGPLVGGAVIEGISWQWIFWLNVPVGLVLAPLAARRLRREPRPAAPARPARRRARLRRPARRRLRRRARQPRRLGLARGRRLDRRRRRAARSRFVAWELRAPAPMLPMRFFRSRAFAATNGVSLAMTFGIFGSIFLLAQFFQTVQSYSPLEAGLRTLPWTGMPMLVAPIAGVLSDRIGSRPLMAPACSCRRRRSSGSRVVTEPDVAYGLLVPAFVMGGTGMALVFAPAANAVLGAVRPEEAGQASGANNAIRELGGVLGVAVLAAVFTGAGGFETPQAFVDGLVPGAVGRRGGARRRRADRARWSRARRASTAARGAESRAARAPCPPPPDRLTGGAWSAGGPARRPGAGVGSAPCPPPRTPLPRRPDHRLLVGDRRGDRPPPRRARLDRLRHRAPARDARAARGGRLPDARPRRHRRGLHARPPSPPSRRSTAPSACSSTTRATASRARSRACRIDQVRAQFETNVFGLVRMCQLVLPRMRAQRWGRIVNVSSMGGRLTFPGGGHYHASKYAVEAISDALRFEVERLRRRRRDHRARDHPSPASASTHARGCGRGRSVRRLRGGGRAGLRRRLREGPAAPARRPARGRRAADRQGHHRDAGRARATRVTASAKALIAQQALLPDAAWDAVMRTTFPQPGPE